MKKFLFVLFSLFLMIALFAGCNDIPANDETNFLDGNVAAGETHTHSFSEYWTRDENYHWHDANCFHNVISDKGAHQWDEGTVTQEPTESSDGIKTYTCSVCGATKTESVEKITKLQSGATISFDLNGGYTSLNSEPITVESLEDERFFFDVKRAGHFFRGWNCNGIKVFDENGVIVNCISLQANMTFVAAFSSTAKLTLTSNISNAGSLTGKGAYAYNTKVDVVAQPNQGYEFVGWMYEDILLSNQREYQYRMWDKDVTLLAVFKYIDYSFTVRTSNEEKGLIVINPIGNIDLFRTTAEEIFSYRDTVTVAAFSKTETRFLGWFDDENQLVSTNAVYTFEMPHKNYTLTAKWNYFTITYDLDGGTNDSGNPTWYNTDTDVITLHNPTKDGQVFIGWRYDNKSVSSINTQIENDIKLYATWSTIARYRVSETEVVILDGVTTIGQNAFYNCESLQSVTIPKSVTSIEYSAFAYCSGLTTINYKGTKAQWNAIEKKGQWNYRTGNYTIHCTDGDIIVK